MATSLDNDECFPQLLLRVAVQNTFQFLVDRVLSRRQHVKVKDSRTQSVNENQPTKIPIPCDEEATLILGGPQQIFVICLRKSDLSRGNDVVPEA